MRKALWLARASSATNATIVISAAGVGQNALDVEDHVKCFNRASPDLQVGSEDLECSALLLVARCRQSVTRALVFPPARELR